MANAMINLLCDKEKLIINGDTLSEWNHHLFFTVILGFEFNRVTNNYSYPISEDIYYILSELVHYFESEKYNYKGDERIENYLQVISNERTDFDSAKNIDGEIKNLVSPNSLVRQLAPYQKNGFAHLVAKKHAANFSVPGSGKTTVVYAAYSYLKDKGEIDKLLVVGPRSAFLPWEDEALACFGKPIRSARLSGSKSLRASIYLRPTDFDLFLCTYQTLANDVYELSRMLGSHNFMVIIDESHNIKKIDGGVWADALLKLSRFAKRRVALSGTPIPNSTEDLWNQFTFLWPGYQVLGDKESYKNLANSKDNIKVIREAITPFFFRVKKSELNLPKPEFIIYKYPLNPYQKKIYQALSVKFLQQSEFSPEERIHLRNWRRAKLVRLIQAASNPTLLLRHSVEFDVPPLSGEDSSIIELIENYSKYETPIKFERLLRITNNAISQGEKIVIWTSFIHNILMLKELLKDFNTYIIYGGVPKDDDENLEFNREQQIHAFKANQKPCILIANPAACAESISLHKACHQAIYLDRTFNCGQYLQSLDRIHRIGLNKGDRIMYHILEAEDSIDETIHRRLFEKEKNMLRILDDDLPIGSFDIGESLLSQSDDEEVIDFGETIKDIKTQLAKPS